MPDIKHFDPAATLETVERLFWRRGVASTGIQDVVTATGLNRSSLYATFGGKQELYRAALRRYLEQRALPAFRHLADDPRGLPAVEEFFTVLIELRCAGEFARWGCLVCNASAAQEQPESGVQDLLEEHHQALRAAMESALGRAADLGQLAPGTDPANAAELLALLAYGVNVRSRAGGDARELHRTVTAALGALGSRTRA